MRNKTFKILLVIIGVLILFTGGLLITKILDDDNSTDSKPIKDTPLKEEAVDTLEVKRENTLDVCKEEPCNIYGGQYYKINYSGDIDEVKSIVNNINNETQQVYEIANTSNMEDESCASFRNLYNHSIITFTEYFNYEDENFVSIAILRNKKNICTNEIESEQKAYIYDKNEKKVITQEEFIVKLNVTQDEINNAIQQSLDTLNTYDRTNYTIENTYQDGVRDSLIFYNDDGRLFISYKQNETGIHRAVDLRSAE